LGAVTTVLDIVEGKDVAVIGTIYKDMKLKPSILDEYTKVPPALSPALLPKGPCGKGKRPRSGAPPLTRCKREISTLDSLGRDVKVLAGLPGYWVAGYWVA
jgi:DNA polymerase delta subunit OB-fold domain